MARRIQLRRDTSANWSTTNPTLAQGEVGVDLTNNKIKIGNGTQNWNALAYFDDKETVLSNYAGDIVPSTDDEYSLGAPDKRWKDIFVTEGSIYIGDVKLSNVEGKLVINRVTDGGLESEDIVEGGADAVQVDLTGYATEEYVDQAVGAIEIPQDIGDLTDTEGLLGQGGGDTGDITFNGTTISAPNDDAIRIEAKDENGDLRAYFKADPADGQAEMRALSSPTRTNFSLAGSDWQSAQWVASGGQGYLEFTDATNIIEYFNNTPSNQYIRINGGEPVMRDGGGSISDNDISIPTSVFPPSTTVVTTVEFYYMNESRVEIDYDGDINIYGDQLDIDIESTESVYVLGSDVEISAYTTLKLQNYASDQSIEIITNGDDDPRIWNFGVDGSLTLPGDHKIFTGGDSELTLLSLGGMTLGKGDPVESSYDSSVTIGDDVVINTNISDDIKQWQFSTDGDLILPAGGDIKDSEGNSVLGGGGGDTGDITFAATTISAANGSDITIEAKDEDGVANTTIKLDPEYAAVRLSAKSSDSKQFYEGESQDYATGTWTTVNGSATLSLTGATRFFDFINDDSEWQEAGDRETGEFSLDGDTWYQWPYGYSSSGAGQISVTFSDPSFTAGDPVGVETFYLRWTNESYITVDQDDYSEVKIVGAGVGVKIQSTDSINTEAGDSLNFEAQNSISLQTIDEDVRIRTNIYDSQQSWEFKTDGTLKMPDAGELAFYSGGTEAGRIIPSTSDGGGLQVDANVDFEIRVTQGEGEEEETAIWSFEPNGDLVFPDGTTQTTAYTGAGSSDRLVNGELEVVLGSTGVLTFPTADFTEGSEVFPALSFPVPETQGGYFGVTPNGLGIGVDGDIWEFRPASGPYTQGLYLPNGGIIAEADISGIPTIELIPANPDTASQRLIVKGGGPIEEYHLHLTTGDLTTTNIFLGTDEHNVRTKIDGSVELTSYDYDEEYIYRLTLKNNVLRISSTADEGDEDLYIKAEDDLYLDALDDDIHLRADDDIRIQVGFDFEEDDYQAQWVFRAGDENTAYLEFPDGSYQRTAWSGGRVVAVPGSSTGAEGDKAGDIAFSPGHLYYCFEDYDSGVSYNTTLSNITEDDNKFTFAKDEGIITPEIGWSITVDVGGLSEETNTITNVEDLGTDWRVTWSGGNGTFSQGTAIRIFSTNIWKRVAWSNDVW